MPPATERLEWYLSLMCSFALDLLKPWRCLAIIGDGSFNKKYVTELIEYKASFEHAVLRILKSLEIKEIERDIISSFLQNFVYDPQRSLEAH